MNCRSRPAANGILNDGRRYTARGSYDSFDDAAPSNGTSSASPRRQHNSKASDTFGTYIYNIPYNANAKYHTRDPSRCNCRCCPHPLTPGERGSSDYRFDKSRRGGPHAYFRGEYSLPEYSSHSSYQTEDRRRYSRHSLHRSNRHNDQTFDAIGHDANGTYAFSPCAKGKPRRDRGNVIVEVVDRTAIQHLGARYGKTFPLAVSVHDTSARDISLFLAPDQEHERVVVRWRGGELEPLDDLVPIADLGSPGTRLEVRTRKNVHWT